MLGRWTINIERRMLDVGCIESGGTYTCHSRYTMNGVCCVGCFFDFRMEKTKQKIDYLFTVAREREEIRLYGMWEFKWVKMRRMNASYRGLSYKIDINIQIHTRIIL